MIIKLYANDCRFKPIEFKKGLNIINVEQSETSNDRDTRNGVGKTTLIHIIDFCLGADLRKTQIPVKHLEGWIFKMDLMLQGRMFDISRGIDTPKFITIKGDCSNFPISPERNEEGQHYTIEDWRKILGEIYFHTPTSEKKQKSPSFRSLLAYFIRKNKSAYNLAFETFSKMSSQDRQMNNAFLLGINWENVIESSDLDTELKKIKSRKTLIKEGFLGDISDLDNKIVRLQKQIDFEKNKINTFQVHDQHMEVQSRANQLTKEMGLNTKERFLLERQLAQYNSSIEEENLSEQYSVKDLYKEMGVHLSDNITKTLDEVKDFHKKTLQNRQVFLKNEIIEIELQIKQKDEIHVTSDKERAELLKILNTHGALEDYNNMRDVFEKHKRNLDKLEDNRSKIKSIDGDISDIKVKKATLESLMHRNYEEMKVNWQEAIELFQYNSNYLYNKAGKLKIEINNTSYKFDIEIDAKDSEGISSMQIFCYDLMLFTKFRNKNGIDFLIHDSTLYDSVDDRQIVKALELAHKKTNDTNGQYICTFNSDTLQNLHFSEDFIYKDYIITTLRDKTPSDSLLGFRYN